LLPEDGAAAGFDNVGAALSTSSQLLERYLEAADVALKAAMIDTPRPARRRKNSAMSTSQRSSSRSPAERQPHVSR